MACPLKYLFEVTINALTSTEGCRNTNLVLVGKIWLSAGCKRHHRPDLKPSLCVSRNNILFSWGCETRKHLLIPAERLGAILFVVPLSVQWTIDQGNDIWMPTCRKGRDHNIRGNAPTLATLASNRAWVFVLNFPHGFDYKQKTGPKGYCHCRAEKSGI